jgi:hypothetical protein
VTRRGRGIAAAAVAVLALAVLWGKRALTSGPSNAEIAGQAPMTILSGKIVEERGKIRPIMTEKEILAILGPPAKPSRLERNASAARWIYPYRDGRMELTLHYGYVQSIEMDFP